jgi:hypothetical protein
MPLSKLPLPQTDGPATPIDEGVSEQLMNNWFVRMIGVSEQGSHPHQETPHY